MKVRAGKQYLYVPCGWDIFDARTNLKPGDAVTVVKLPGCPPPNTMGHAHVNHNGAFAGLVCTGSLQPMPQHGKKR